MQFKLHQVLYPSNTSLNKTGLRSTDDTVKRFGNNEKKNDKEKQQIEKWRESITC